MNAEFVPAHFEKALDTARHIATFGRFEFLADRVAMRILDPAKVVYLELTLLPETYKVNKEFNFGVHLGMFYKLVKSLNNDDPVEIECDETIMKINQGSRYHTLVAQDIPWEVPTFSKQEGPVVELSTKLLQRYIRALANIAPAVELNYVPTSDTLFLESVNSMYRTLLAMETGATPNECEEYRKQFMIAFLEKAVNPGLASTVSVYFGDTLRLSYSSKSVLVDVYVSGYTEG